MDNNEISNDDGKYRATSNLNTAIENPEFNVNTPTDINIQNSVEDSNFAGDTSVSFDDNQVYQSNMVSNQDNSVNSSFDDNQIYQSNMVSNQEDSFDSLNNNGSVDNQIYQSNVVTDEATHSFIPSASENNSVSNDSYVAVGNNEKYEPVMENKKKDSKITIPRDLKVILFIVFVLVIFVLLMPYIYDFFKGLGLVVTSNGK